jgi:antitoxin VapB
MRGRAFKSGNSIAVRIPRELGVIEATGEVDIQRVGDTLVIRQMDTGTLAHVMEKFCAFPPGFMAEGRESNEERERNW